MELKAGLSRANMNQTIAYLLSLLICASGAWNWNKVGLPCATLSPSYLTFQLHNLKVCIVGLENGPKYQVNLNNWLLNKVCGLISMKEFFWKLGPIKSSLVSWRFGSGCKTFLHLRETILLIFRKRWKTILVKLWKICWECLELHLWFHPYFPSP